ncbi:MAG: prepilin-type N-terminal cleavage/methylation domain-containing protein [Phycisphaerae bacterium]|nr:prepilin-type N-terminal cleavage/methylation domain-containing protein [Phycisphaerae bacterium]
MIRRAFTLVEVLLAVFILGIGIISVSALFPAGIVQQRASNDDALGPVVAQHAMGVIRSKVGQDDFGTFEEYGLYDLGGTAPSTIPGDWHWKRPTVYFQPQLTGVGWTDGNVEDDTGAIDVFGTLLLNAELGLGPTNNLNLSRVGSEFSTDGLGNAANRVYGIPVNRRKWDPDLNTSTPLWIFADYDGDSIEDNGELLERQPNAIITQAERWWPAMPPSRLLTGGDPAGEANELARRKPQFVWDCMFRRFEGRILVAVFVYRVGTAGVEAGPYRVAQASSISGLSSFPSMPRFGSFVATTIPGPIALTAAATPRAGGVDGNVGTRADNVAIPGTNPGTPTAGFNATNDLYAWQAPNQLWLDQWNDIHRVVGGRRTSADGPVTLARPISAKVPSAVYFGVGANGLPLADPGTLPVIWYLPTEDANGASISPVYITVMEL